MMTCPTLPRTGSDLETVVTNQKGGGLQGVYSMPAPKVPKLSKGTESDSERIHRDRERTESDGERVHRDGEHAESDGERAESDGERAESDGECAESGLYAH
ncbi:Hypothetical predicted protein [Scomber scombrus]|uniref:Uncharacterized protein n=1 Tax=Scomber scombrus TaxID=13677 RepID=A0AAV1Q5X3_SCOSC